MYFKFLLMLIVSINLIAIDNDQLFTKNLIKAKIGYPRAQYALGVMYFNSSEINRFQKALKWFLVAANKGHEKAQYYVGLMYSSGCLGS